MKVAITSGCSSTGKTTLSGNPARVLAQGNIKIYTGAGDMTVKDAYEAYKKGELKEF